MKFARLTMMALTVSVLAAACGGGDTEDRLDVADPKVRFVDAITVGPAVTLYRDEVPQSDASGVDYKFASKYYDVSLGSATWSIRTADSSATTLASVPFDAGRGNRYTIVGLQGSGTTAADALFIQDPYNKGLTSDKARVRVVNAALNTSSVDVYLTGANVDLSTVAPTFAAVGYKTAVPGTGADSIEVNGGAYQLRITTAGTKTVIFNATVNLDNNADWLMLTIPHNTGAALVDNDIEVLVAKGNDTDNGTTTEITNTP